MSLLTRNLAEENAPASKGSVFSQGLKSGALNAGAGLAALAGTGAETVGLDGVSQSLYDTSRGLRDRGIAAAPEIQSVSQVNGLDSGLRYAAGLAGQALPALGAGLVGAAVSRNPLVGASLATAPFTIGDVALRQQEDPTIAAMPAGQRLGQAVGAGGMNAVASNVVPIALGGKLVGRGISEAGMGLGRNIATNVGEGVVGNAAAGVLGEHLTQQSLTNLNADRDTSGDQQALIDAGAGGAVIGAPFAAAGIAGQAMHGKAPAPRTDGVPLSPRTPTDGAPTLTDGAPTPTGPDGGAPTAPSLMERMKGAFKKDETATEMDTAERIAKNQDVIDRDALRRASPEEQSAMLRDADKSRVDQVMDWAKQMVDDVNLSPEARTAVDKFMANPADRTQQAAVAAAKVTRDTAENAYKKVKEFSSKISEDFDEKTLSGHAKAAGDMAKAAAKDLVESWGKRAEGVELGDRTTAARTVAGDYVNEFSKDIAARFNDVDVQGNAKVVKDMIAQHTRQFGERLAAKLETTDAGNHAKVAKDMLVQASRDFGDTVNTRFEESGAKNTIKNAAMNASIEVFKRTGVDLAGASKTAKDAAAKYTNDFVDQMSTHFDKFDTGVDTKTAGDMAARYTKQFATDLSTKLKNTDVKTHAKVAKDMMADYATRIGTEASKRFTAKNVQDAAGAAKTTVTEGATNTMNSAREFYNDMGKRFDDAMKNSRDNKKSLMDSPKLRAKISDTVAPALAERFPDVVKNPQHLDLVSGSLHRIMASMQHSGKLDGDVVEQLHGWFGDDAPSVMASLHSAVLDGKNVPATEKYFGAINKMTDEMSGARSLETQIKSALPEAMQKDATPAMLKKIVERMREHVDGTDMKGKPKTQVDFETSQIEAGLRQQFGDKTDGILKAFQKDAERRAKSAREELDVGSEEMATMGERDIAEEAETTQYLGGGKDKAKPQLVRSPEAHRAEFDNAGQAERLLRQAQVDNPDRIVKFTKVKDLPEEQRSQYKDAGPDDGLVTIEGTKDDMRITPDEFEGMRVDTSKTSHAQNNLSRIDTGVKGAVMDARAIVKAMKGKLDFSESDGISERHRTARAFMEGIAGVQDHLGQAFEIPDSTVIDAKGLTYGEAKKLSMRQPDPAWMKGKTDEQINTEINRRDALKEMTDRELEKSTLRAQDVLAKRERAFQDQVDEARRNGTKLVKADYAELRRTMGVDDARAAVRAAENEGETRAGAVRRAGNLDAEGRTEVSPNEDIHTAADHLSESELKRRVGLDDNALRYENFAQRKADGSLPDAVVSAIGTKINKLENLTRDGTVKGQPNMVARRVGVKAREVFDRFGQMTRVDQAMLASIVKDGKISSISETVNTLYDKYAARAAKAEASTKPVTDVKTKMAIQKLAAGIEMSSGDLMLKLDRFAQKSGREGDALIRAFAQQIGKPVEKLKGLGDLYAQTKESAPKKLNAFTERVLGEGDLGSITKQIKASDDAKALQRVVDSLAEHADNPRAEQVLKAANERITKMIEADPDVAYSMQRVDPNLTNVSSRLTDVQAYVYDVLGATVDVEFNKMLHAGEFVRDAKRAAAGMGEDVIRVSVHAMDPMSTAYHESLHAFFRKLRDGQLMDDASPMMKAADSVFVKAKLRELLAGEPDAIKQIDSSLEERAAYMYQFWAAGKLELPTKPTTVLGHVADFFRKMIGVWSNDERATHIMEYFRKGDYRADFANRSAVSRALMKGTNERIESFKKMAEPLTRLGDIVLSTGSARLRDTMIPALHELVDQVYAPLQGASDDPGYIPASRIKRGEVMNDLAAKLGDIDTAAVTDAMAAMQRGEKGSTPEERIAIRHVRKMLDGMHDYMTEAGVKVKDLGYGKDYFPRSWDANIILDKRAEFAEMLERYRTKGDFHGSVDEIISVLTRADGSELQVETMKPGMQNTKERVLGFISALDAAPFVQKDAYRTLNSYVTQATRRAEWARRFSDDGSVLQDMLTRARDEGASQDDILAAGEFLQSVDGTLGDKINPKLRRAFGNMIVYQNVRLLPLALFSSLIDPMGIMVRGGTVKDSFKAFKRGITEIPKGFKKNATHDEWTKLAATMGVIDSAVLMKSLGTSFSQGMTGDTGRKVNDVFFKYNLMEQFNTSMRVGATEAAVNFMATHADGTGTHSTRWLAELGMKPNEIVVKNGRPLLTVAEFKAHGMGDAAAEAMAVRMTLAVNKWVDGAVLRPNAAHKPLWMSDPHFALVAHLKQFVYSFQETILKRVVNEAKYGNIQPALALASYVPFMIAADMMKGMVVSGGGQPDYKEGWDAGDYVWSGLERAGVFGVGQFGLDVAKDVQRGGFGVGALAGPTVEQLGDAASVVGGAQQFKTFAMNAIPANQLLDAAEEAVNPRAE